MKRYAEFAAAAALALALTGCATMISGGYAERGVDFTRYRTFAWGPSDMLPTGDARLDNNPFFHRQVRAAVAAQLGARGITEAPYGAASCCDPEGADLLIHYHASVDQKVDVYGVDERYGYCTGSSCEPRVVEYEEGTLLFDFVDARTSRVIWRGWARDVVDGVIDNQERMEKKINQAVSRIFAGSPFGRAVTVAR